MDPHSSTTVESMNYRILVETKLRVYVLKIKCGNVKIFF